MLSPLAERAQLVKRYGNPLLPSGHFSFFTDGPKYSTGLIALLLVEVRNVMGSWWWMNNSVEDIFSAVIVHSSSIGRILLRWEKMTQENRHILNYLLAVGIYFKIVEDEFVEEVAKLHENIYTPDIDSF